MTTPTWPDPTRPGVPLNPEKDGWHWLTSWILTEGWEAHMPWCGKWVAARGEWTEMDTNAYGGMDDWEPSRLAAEFHYIAPCLTPAEVAETVKLAVAQEREAVETSRKNTARAEQVRQFMRREPGYDAS